jgi:hypothetical protein
MLTFIYKNMRIQKPWDGTMLLRGIKRGDYIPMPAFKSDIIPMFDLNKTWKRK